MPFYKLTLDVPHSFAVEPGYLGSTHHADFTPKEDAFVNTWREPYTGLVMLKPNFLDRDFSQNFKEQGDWRTQPDWWQGSKRSEDKPNMLTHVKPAGEAPTGVGLSDVNAGLVTRNADAAKFDDLRWAIESKFHLEIDEGFTLHMHAIADEFLRKENWFAVQWANIQLHFSQDGWVRAYEHDPSDMSDTPLIRSEYVFSSPGELLNRPCYFSFIPIAGVGLLILHSYVKQRANLISANPGANAQRPIVIPWPAKRVGGKDRLFERSLIRVAVNPYQETLLGMQVIRYPESGTYKDAHFDPGYKPALDPDTLAVTTMNTQAQTVAIALRNKDNSGAWAAGTDQEGRVMVTLTAGDSGRYTPFVYAYTLEWMPQFASRTTAPLVIPFENGGRDNLTHLEWTEDEYGRFEGKAEVELGSVAGRRIAERGDSTFLLEKSEDGVSGWETINGGFATDFALVCDANGWGFRYTGTLSLRDMSHRLRETHRNLKTAFDNLSVAGAVNTLLTGSMMEPLVSFSPVAANVFIPGAQALEKWNNAPTHGDVTESILHWLLLFLKTQYVEYRLRYDWNASGWVLEQRPRPDFPQYGWVLTPDSEDKSLAGRSWAYGPRASFQPEPPEATRTRVVGITNKKQAETFAVWSSPLVDTAAETDPNADNYLGRTRYLPMLAPNLTDKGELNKANRRLFSATRSRRQKLTPLPLDGAQLAIEPNTPVTVEDGCGGFIIEEGYVKMRTVIVNTPCMDEEMTLHIDSVYDSRLTGRAG